MPKSIVSSQGAFADPQLTALFRAIADYTYDWESWVDPQGVTRWINPAVERMTGFDVHACLSMRNYPLRLVYKDDRPRVRKALQSAAQRQSGNDLEFRILRKDGGTRWGAISWQSLYAADGTWQGYRTSVRDVDARKRAEDDLRQAKTRAEEADRAKSDFLATMSHEIRSPIQCISGYAQLIERTELTSEQRRYLKILSQQNEMLLKIVDDILNFSSLQAVTPQLERHRFDVVDVVQAVVEAIKPKAKEKRLALDVKLARSARLSVVGDSYRVQQILANLVNNAVKFTERGAVTVDVRARVGEGQRVHVTFAVSDTGIGIDAKAARRLFEPFSQGDASTTRRYGGSGLGLAISHKLATAMGGSLTFRKKPKGACFVAVVPFVQARASQARPPAPTYEPEPPAHQPKLRILVVDDNAEARELAQAMLRHLGFPSDVAANGRTAVQMAKRVPYDLLLMDLRMPDMDGLQTTTKLRQSALGQPRIYAMTANVLAEDRQACSNAGMDGFLGKPVRLTDLKRLLLQSQPRRVRSARKKPKPVLDAKVINDLKQSASVGGASLLQTFGPRVCAAMTQSLRKLQEQAELGDSNHVAAVAHDLKGHARMIGARVLARRLALVERTALAGDVPTRVQLERIAEGVATATTALQLLLR
ncbi:MAG: ATP-binding protein [Deltaproteobacteria bacterium]|nr:ATP-binding protein [Deltaproteobacteria bacterium]